jgi:hypothetical protein
LFDVLIESGLNLVEKPVGAAGGFDFLPQRIDFYMLLFGGDQ